MKTTSALASVPPTKWLPGATSLKMTCAKNAGAPVTSLCRRVIAAAISCLSAADKRSTALATQYVGMRPPYTLLITPQIHMFPSRCRTLTAAGVTSPHRVGDGDRAHDSSHTGNLAGDRFGGVDLQAGTHQTMEVN